ncbi:MAG: hypothetical protein JWQ93_3450 [Marmoricola sp.]|nr:hypothetical protein [Marmoricola sp.]
MIDTRLRIAAAVALIFSPGIAESAAAATRSRTIFTKRGSEVYCAMPWPRANGSEPRSRSCGRQPRVVVSTVTTSAFAPLASARWIIESTRGSSVDQYSWYQNGVPPIAFAVSPIGLQPCEEKT